MLINAQYLDSDALTNYIAAVEGGVRQTGSTRSTGAHGLGGSFGVNAMKIEGRRNAEVENTLNIEDHDASRLKRLIDAGHADPDGLSWVEILEPDHGFSQVSIGAFVEWECDIYVPEGLAAISSHGDLSGTLKMMQGLMPSAEALGLDTAGLPRAEQMQAMSEFLEGLNVAPIVVGDDSDTEWKVVGSLNKQWIREGASLDDRVRIIGKVKKQVPHGRWHPIVSLPGMNLLNRDERRRKERDGPGDSGQESQFVRGPLLVVEYLAIYS